MARLLEPWVRKPVPMLAWFSVVVAAGIAALVRIVRMLDLDHIGTHQPELIRRERPRQHMRDVDDADALEWTRHDRFPY